MKLVNVFQSKTNTVQVVWIALGGFSSVGLSIASAAILSRFFDKTEYGTYRQILYVYNTLLVIFAAGLPRVFTYFLPRFSLSQGKSIVKKVSKVLFLTGICFSFTLFCCSGIIAKLLRNPELSIGLKYFSVIPILLLPTLGIEGILSSYKKAVFIALYNIIINLLMLTGIVLPVVILGGSYLYAIYGWIFISIIAFVIAFYFKNIPFKNIESESTDLNTKEIFKYSLPIALASLSGIAIKAADQFYISRFFSTEVFAEFANGFIQLPFVSTVTGATSAVLMPLFSKMIFDKSEGIQIINLWQNTLQKSALIIYPLIIFFLFFGKETIILLYSHKYEESFIYFTIGLTINFFNIIVFAPLLLALGETRFYARLHFFFAISSWLLGYVVVIIFNNPVAVAVFSTIQSISLVLIAIIYTSKRTKLKLIEIFPLGNLLKICAHSMLSIIIVRIAFNFLHVTNYFIMIILSFLCFLLILLTSSGYFEISYSGIFKPMINK
ncbi:MAG TPA: oligosaccharide flippase family protein [Bacteroidales bacterium]|nr:oligosaccharide flippase family protein [Bacteroidales bacterium]